MKRLALRWMLLIPILTSIVVGFVAFAIAVDVSERTLRLSEVDAELVRAENFPISVTPPGDGGTVEPPNVPQPTPNDSVDAGDQPVQLIVAQDGTILGSQGSTNPFSSSERATLGAQTLRSTTTVDGYRVLVSPLPNGPVQITALSLDSYHAAIDSLRQTLILGGVVIVLIEAGVVWILASRLARPLAVTAAAVSRVADGELDYRIQPASGSREVAKLSVDIARMVDRLRAALVEREESAADATRARDDMRRLLADVAHEIRTPLTALKGYSELYGRGMLETPEALDRAMSRVGAESTRLHELVNTMLQLARGNAPEASVRIDVDLASVARDVVDDLSVAFPGRHIDLDASADSRLVGDPARLHQALLNLGVNACRHTPTDTSISVVIDAVGTAVTASIIDHGPGIPDDDIEHIFLPFYRADPSRARDGHDGAGLGLAVTRQIADEHGGSVLVRATPGGGATFVFGLPAEDATVAGVGG